MAGQTLVDLDAMSLDLSINAEPYHEQLLIPNWTLENEREKHHNAENLENIATCGAARKRCTLPTIVFIYTPICPTG